MDQRVNFSSRYNEPVCAGSALELLELDPKPDDLTLTRPNLPGQPVVEGRTLVCCIRLGGVEVRSDKLLESGDFWFSAKSMLVERLWWQLIGRAIFCLGRGSSRTEAKKTTNGGLNSAGSQTLGWKV